MRRLFQGRTDAIGRNQGGVERRIVTEGDYYKHFQGEHPIGIFPMLDDNTCWFGAIDLDEPNFELASQMQLLIPNPSWIEKSRNGNAHVWVFFQSPAPAWVVRTVLRGATQAVGRSDVEIFPKQDALKPGMVGNYINLPLFGDERPILHMGTTDELRPTPVASFLHRALETRHDPAVWERRARALGGKPPEEREVAREFGTATVLHECASHIIENRESNPLRRGHRAVVLFNLSKMLLNWEALDAAEARKWVGEVNAAGTHPVDVLEVDRIFNNALEGRWTSTGCDDPLMAPYVRPDCPIANG